MANRKLGRPSDHRMQMLKNLVRDLLTEEEIVTTVTRAKETAPLAEKMITLTKEDSLHTRRMARKFLNDETLVNHLFNEIGPRYRDRPGGYTRIIRIGVRRGDAAPIAKLSLVEG
ncbi:MAG: 50S ribosomal protein L17 [Armatimonadetes bacterium]|nr:50S ribosomal protein L17 [Armatimonadota bacterium]